MTTADLPKRRRQGAMQQIQISAPSLAAAHGKLGSQLSALIRRVARQRLKATSADQFARQIAAIRTCRDRLANRIDTQLTRPLLRQGLAEYRECLRAWTAACELESIAEGRTVADLPVTAEELALWLQDDNTGCQTGLLRLTGGSVLFWHTEEDTIGYLDQPRLAAITAGGQTWHAFLYPYLLPGPAFGWHAGWFHAVDSLPLERSEHGTITAIAAWLAWRFGPAIGDQLVGLVPFVDGCAIHLVGRGEDGVSAGVQELGWLDSRPRPLTIRAGSLVYQANCVHDLQSRLGHRESLSAADRERYCQRGERAKSDVAELRKADDATPQGLVKMLASKRGGAYANANADVKAYCVGHATTERIDIFVQAGAAQSGDVYQPQFHA